MLSAFYASPNPGNAGGLKFGLKARRSFHILILFYVISTAYNSVNAGTVNLAEKEVRMKNSNFQEKEKRREIRIGTLVPRVHSNSCPRPRSLPATVHFQEHVVIHKV